MFDFFRRLRLRTERRKLFSLVDDLYYYNSKIVKNKLRLYKVLSKEKNRDKPSFQFNRLIRVVKIQHLWFSDLNSNLNQDLLDKTKRLDKKVKGIGELIEIVGHLTPQIIILEEILRLQKEILDESSIQISQRFRSFKHQFKRELEIYDEMKILISQVKSNPINILDDFRGSDLPHLREILSDFIFAFVLCIIIIYLTGYSSDNNPLKELNACFKGIEHGFSETYVTDGTKFVLKSKISNVDKYYQTHNLQGITLDSIMLSVIFPLFKLAHGLYSRNTRSLQEAATWDYKWYKDILPPDLR